MYRVQASLVVAALLVPGLLVSQPSAAPQDLQSQDVGSARVVPIQITGDPEARQTLIDDVAALLRARHGVEARVELVGHNALPQTSSGKLSRSKARTLFLAGAFKQEEPGTQRRRALDSPTRDLDTLPASTQLDAVLASALAAEPGADDAPTSRRRFDTIPLPRPSGAAP